MKVKIYKRKAHVKNRMEKLYAKMVITVTIVMK